MKSELPAVLILTSDAEEYLPLLEELNADGVDLAVATTVREARQIYRGQTVALAQPDLLAAALDHMPELQWAQSSWAGVTPLLDNGRRDYQLTGVKGVFGQQMAEYILGYLLAHELKIFERLERQANRAWWDEPSGMLRGKTLGIMGTGSIGCAIAKAAKAFGMGITGFSRSGAVAEGFGRVYGEGELDAFLPRCDHLVCVLPDTPATRHLLGRPEFQSLQKGCYLVNVGRGNVIDESALTAALVDGQLAGAALDVFQQEPLPKESPLWDAPGLLVTGHISGNSFPTEIARIFIENYRRWVQGKALLYPVDFERGY